MAQFLQARAWRAGLLLVIGCVFGTVLIAPVTARVHPASGSPTITYTRSVSCAGLSFYPSTSSTAYGNWFSRRYWKPTGTGDGVFRCDPGLPNGAVVMKVQFTLYDRHANAEVSQCQLVRTGLTVATADLAQELASVPGTGVGAAPGTVRKTDTSISYATVNNAKFAYWLNCRLEASVADPKDGPSIALYGADVIYSISAANG